MLRRLAAVVAGEAIALLARFLTAPRAIWSGVAPEAGQRVYFANHTSHGDFVLLWTVLPPALRAATRPVAAADYWLQSGLRRFIGRDVFDAVLIDRRPEMRTEDPVAQMVAALDAGASLMLFPEGRRNDGTAPLLPLKSGLFHLASARPGIDLVPVWIGNLDKVLPRGRMVPLPLACTVTFGAPIRLAAGEARDAFLARARAALLAIAEVQT